MAGFTRDSEAVPTTREILLAASTLIHADGAGLRKRPTRTSYTNKYVPTLVSVTNPTQTHVINLLGHDITITLKATNYEWDWGDGTPNTVTAYQGMAFEKGMDPNKDPRLIRHYYTPPNGWRSRFDGPYPNATRTITLTTTWSGTATNPFTGETQTINGLVTTKETTGPFPSTTSSSQTPTPGKKNKATSHRLIQTAPSLHEVGCGAVVRCVVKSVGKGCESLPHALAVPFADLYQCFECSINFRVLF